MRMRVPRFYAPGTVHHVIARLVDRKFFLDLPGARPRYLALLASSIAKSDWCCLGYALMSNHVHLLMLAGHQEPAMWLRRVHSPFAFWLNQAHAGLGVIFAERPKLIIVEDHKVAPVLAYIHNNPVRAGLVASADGSKWTSHRAYIGADLAPTWLDVADGLARIGSPSTSQFDAFVNAEVGSADLVEETESLEDRLRPLAHRRGATLATPVYGDPPQVPLVRRENGRVRPDAGTVIATTCFAAGVDEARVYDRGQNEIRRLVLVVGRAYGLSFAEMSAAMGFTRQFAQHLANDLTDIDVVSLELAMRLLGEGRWVRPVDKLASVPRQVSGRIAGGRRRD